jgi:hypothetical protein
MVQMVLAVSLAFLLNTAIQSGHCKFASKEKHGRTSSISKHLNKAFFPLNQHSWLCTINVFISKKYAVTSWRVCHHSVTKILFKYNLAELTTVTGIFAI